MATLSQDAKNLIDRPNFAHLATLMPDGSPNSTPVWIWREGDNLIICTTEGSLKAKNTKRDKRVAVSIVDFHNPYEEAQIRGHVIERRDDAGLKLIDRTSQKYIGGPFPLRDHPGAIALVIAVDKQRYAKLPGFEHAPPKK